jgi:peptide/nickel transport system permease protein
MSSGIDATLAKAIEKDSSVQNSPEGPEKAPPVRKIGRAYGLKALFTTNNKATIGICIIIFFLLMAIFGEYITPYEGTDRVSRPHQPPSSDYWFGTDSGGRDVFSRTIIGARRSIAVGLIVGTIVTVTGIIVGMAAGYFRGWIDDVLSTITNVVLIIPGLPLMLMIAGFLSPGFWTITLVLSLTGWAWGARVLRSQTLALREKDFVASAKTIGESSPRIILREILPNMLSIVMAGYFGGVNFAIGAAAGLEFLGLGNPTNISWGNNLYWAQTNGALTRGAWWDLLPSGLCIALVAFGFSMINYAIDEVTNPRLRAQRQTAMILKGQPARIRRSRATPVLSEGAGK